MFLRFIKSRINLKKIYILDYIIQKLISNLEIAFGLCNPKYILKKNDILNYVIRKLITNMKKKTYGLHNLEVITNLKKDFRIM